MEKIRFGIIGCGNSLQEALTAGRLFANTLADLLLNG